MLGTAEITRKWREATIRMVPWSDSERRLVGPNINPIKEVRYTINGRGWVDVPVTDPWQMSVVIGTLGDATVCVWARWPLNGNGGSNELCRVFGKYLTIYYPVFDHGNGLSLFNR